MAAALVLLGAGPAAAIGLCESTEQSFKITAVSADGSQVLVARSRETCAETEDGEDRNTETWTSVVGTNGKPDALFCDSADPQVWKAFSRRLGKLARPLGERDAFLTAGGFTPAVSALEVASSGGCTARLVRIRAKGADAAPKAAKAGDDAEQYGLWLDVYLGEKRMAHLWLGKGEDSLSAPAYSAHPVWMAARPGLAVDFELTDYEGYQQPDEPRTAYTRPHFAVLGDPALAVCFAAAKAISAAPPSGPAPSSP